MMAAKWLMPYMPRLLTVNEPPVNSSGFRRLTLARPASSTISAAMADSGFTSASRTMGVTRPPSVATATEMSAPAWYSMASSCQLTFTSGTSRNASAAARTMKSLTDSFTAPP
ncbi:hypothetical protein D3C73_739040 [compost metagenome]